MTELLLRIRVIIVKEFIHVFRDKRMRAIVFVTPLLQIMVFGYVVTTDVTRISAAVCDLDRSHESRELALRLASSGYFDVVRRPASLGDAGALLDMGEVSAAINIMPGFSKEIKRGSAAKLQVIVDGTDSGTASVAASYASKIAAGYAGELSASQGAVKLDARLWYNPDLKSRNYNVPGVIAIVIMLTCLLLTSMAIVRELETGTMEQLLVTPLKPLEIILGKTAPFAIIGFFDMAAVTAVGVLWFGVAIKGSLLFLFFSTAVYLLSVLGIGLLISAAARTQQQALMATFMFYLPAVLLSGFMFPVDGMPATARLTTYVNPLSWFLVIIRGIFLKGAGPGALWAETTAIFALGCAAMAAGALRFKKNLG